MPVEVNVTSDIKKMSKGMDAIRSKIPSITARVVNRLTNWARDEVAKETAAQLKLPVTAVKYTKRKKRGDPTSSNVPRFRVRYRARPGLPVSEVDVVSAGIQVTDVAGAWIGRKPGQKGGVKAKGGRFYRGAFKAPVAGVERVWKRRGKERLPIFLPRIGTRKQMEKAFKNKVEGPAAKAFVEREFERMTREAKLKAGIR